MAAILLNLPGGQTGFLVVIIIMVIMIGMVPVTSVPWISPVVPGLLGI